jgi:hypothetical protein
VPNVLAVGDAGIKLGQHLVAAKDTLLCGLGVSTELHGDSTGVLKELVA